MLLPQELFNAVEGWGKNLKPHACCCFLSSTSIRPRRPKASRPTHRPHACKEAALALHDNYSRLSRRIENLEGDLADSTGLLAEMEVQRDQAIRDLEIRTKDREDLAKQCADLKAALRNAESDLRATQRIIGNFERNQQQDRDEIRQLQKRIERLRCRNRFDEIYPMRLFYWRVKELPKLDRWNRFFGTRCFQVKIPDFRAILDFAMLIRIKSMMRRRVNRVRPSGFVCP